MANPVQASLQKAWDFLETAQQATGGFTSLSSPSPTDFRAAFEYQTSFVPSLILSALSRQPTNPRLLDRLAKFVRHQIQADGSVNYWAIDSEQLGWQPYPNDLDDTACAYIGLVNYDSSFIDSRDMAKLVKLLMQLESQPGGPYRTWLVSPSSQTVWLDVDLAVNSNIAYLLTLVSYVPAKLMKFLGEAIQQGNLNSPYYPNYYPLLYYLSRAYHGAEIGHLQKHALALSRKPQKSALKVALSAISLLNLGYKNIDGLMQSLISLQQPDGSWPAEAFCIDPARAGHTYYNGCASLTTAFAIEALQTHLNQSSVQRTSHSNSTHKTSDLVLSVTSHKLNHLPIELKQGLKKSIARLVASDVGDEIIGLPFLVNESLIKPLDCRPEWLVNLASSNLLGWVAYTIFDDIIDQASSIESLPIATAALRLSLAGFETALANNQVFRKQVQDIFNIIDAANAWELANCRSLTNLPRYKTVVSVADRSLGHSLAALAVLVRSGLALDSKEVKNIQQAFRHYLAARQLNDDLHDWSNDLANGRISLFVSDLLAQKTIKKDLHMLFWQQYLIKFCQIIRRQTACSRRCLANVTVLKSQNFISERLDAIDQSVKETLAAQKDAQLFLDIYKGA